MDRQSTQWSDRFVIGLSEVDRQHKVLIELVDEVREAVYLNDADDDKMEVIDDAVKRLVDYTVSHFDAEQNLMKAANYPVYDDHIALHKRLIDEVGVHVQALKGGDKRSQSAFVAFLMKWLQSHILKDDKAFADYFISSKQDVGLLAIMRKDIEAVKKPWWKIF